MRGQPTAKILREAVGNDIANGALKGQYQTMQVVSKGCKEGKQGNNKIADRWTTIAVLL